MAKPRLPSLAISLGQIVGEGFGKDMPHYMYNRELTLKEKRAIVDFVNSHYKPKPTARKGGWYEPF